MIGTRAQYQITFNKLAHTSIDEPSRLALWRTIEALRRVARMARVFTDTHSTDEDYAMLEIAVDDLERRAPWLLEGDPDD